jgi:hypothetical protein
MKNYNLQPKLSACESVTRGMAMQMFFEKKECPYMNMEMSKNEVASEKK